jgi:pimeloyl-ACP methyl ester carboxylesterase
MYQPVRQSRSEFVQVRGLRYHVRIWDALDARSTPCPPTDPGADTLVMLHGWMDVSASFQFLVDRLAPRWKVVAPDWRGYGLTDRPGADCYWFPDYLGDLDVLLEHYASSSAVKLVGHSMGGNVAMLYAGVRPHRVARLLNLEGLGMRFLSGEQAPERYAQWLDELRKGERLRDYPSRAAVADRLMRNNPRLRADFAAFLAEHWSRETTDGRFEILGDPAHKVVSANLSRVDEVVACWRRIAAPVMLVISEHINAWHDFVNTEEYAQRLRSIPSLERRLLAEAGHMMHHDQPGRVAELIEGFMT